MRRLVSASGDFGLQSSDERAVLALHGDELRHDGADAEGFDIAAEDSGEQRSGELAQHLMIEVSADEGSDGLVCFWCAVFEMFGAAQFIGVGATGFGGEERRIFERCLILRNHEAHAVGDGLKLTSCFCPRSFLI